MNRPASVGFLVLHDQFSCLNLDRLLNIHINEVVGKLPVPGSTPCCPSHKPDSKERCCANSSTAHPDSSLGFTLNDDDGIVQHVEAERFGYFTLS
jgi:hypothetical protein